MTDTAPDHRRATAERNSGAILDAVETLLERGSQISVTAVAAEARVSRMTVYAHFPAREDLLGAAIERAVQRAGVAMEAAELQKGSALDVLGRVIDIAWRELDRNRAVAAAGADHLASAEIMRLHDAAMRPIRDLLERGREEGVFRSDLPADWLVTAFFALLHAGGDEVRRGSMEVDAAPAVLTTTIRSLFTGTDR